MSDVFGYRIVLLLFIALLPPAAYADQPPALVPPTVVYGSITIDGEYAPAGTVVQAVIDGTERAAYTINKGGDYSLPLNVDATDTGKPVLFFVDDVQAPQITAVPNLMSGPIQLDLLITTTSTDMPAGTDSAASTLTSTGTHVPADAQETPAPLTQQHKQPMLFLGTLTHRNNATGIPAGAEVCAYFDSELRGNKVTTVDGQYGIPPDDFNPLTVTGDSTDNGKNIIFTVNGVSVQEYHVADWVVDASNSPHILDLIVGSDDPVADPDMASTSMGGQESTGNTIPCSGALLAITGFLVVYLLNAGKKLW